MREQEPAALARRASRAVDASRGVDQGEHFMAAQCPAPAAAPLGEGQQLKATPGCSCCRSSWPSWDFEADDVSITVGEPSIHDPAKEGAWLTPLRCHHRCIGARPPSPCLDGDGGLPHRDRTFFVQTSVRGDERVGEDRAPDVGSCVAGEGRSWVRG
mgnify:CR=1 FL=1